MTQLSDNLPGMLFILRSSLVTSRTRRSGPEGPSRHAWLGRLRSLARGRLQADIAAFASPSAQSRLSLARYRLSMLS